jgi:hypothetical protein
MGQASQKSRVGAAERAEIFHEQYGNELNGAATLADVVIAAGEYLRRIIGAEDVDPGMARMIERVVNTNGGPMLPPSEWPAALEEARPSCFSEWHLGPQLHDLAAYALYGIVLDDSQDPAELAARIEDLLEVARAFLDATPLLQWNIAGSDLARLVRLAENRWALDNDQPVEPTALAYFGGVSEGRLRNMMAGANRAFTAVDGRIPAQQALGWLSGREEFWNSIWRDQRLPPYGTTRREPVDRAVFLPVARDGSTFHPALHRGSGFTIGAKGEELQIADFHEALAELQRMPVPYWRRPNESGNWGIVAGVRWERLDASELEMLAANPSHRLPEQERA